MSGNKSMRKVKTRDALIFQTPLNTFCETLEVAKKIKERKKQIHHQKITLKSNYSLNIMVKLKETQLPNNKSLIIRMRSNKEKH